MAGKRRVDFMCSKDYSKRVICFGLFGGELLRDVWRGSTEMIACVYGCTEREQRYGL